MSEFKSCDYEGYRTGWKLSVEFSVSLLEKLSSGRFRAKDIRSILLIIKQKAREVSTKHCEGVIKNCEKQGLDAPYTRAVSTILEFSYNKQRKEQ